MINYLFKSRRYYIYSRWAFEKQSHWAIYKKFKNKIKRDSHLKKLNKSNNKLLEYSIENNYKLIEPCNFCLNTVSRTLSK